MRFCPHRQFAIINWLDVFAHKELTLADALHSLEEDGYSRAEICNAHALWVARKEVDA